ncbi:MAG TPA: hypothetical protein VMR21_05970 [Vicinamibacteria bacterium]|nr:hypothetical protein [Vicinamibacteria bacterium]
MIGVFAALLPFAGIGAAAQETPSDPGARGKRRPAREEAFRMVDAYIVSNLQESLGLTDEQFVTLLPLVKRLQADRRAFVQRRQRSLLELRRLLGSGAATESQVAERLRQLKAVEAEEPAVLRRDRDAIDAVLTPVQQAKFRVLELEVERRIRAAMSKIRGQRRGPRRAPRPDGPPPPR